MFEQLNHLIEALQALIDAPHDPRVFGTDNKFKPGLMVAALVAQNLIDKYDREFSAYCEGTPAATEQTADPICPKCNGANVSLDHSFVDIGGNQNKNGARILDCWCEDCAIQWTAGGSK